MEHTARELECRFLIKCENYYLIQCNGETSNDDYLRLRQELNTMFLTLQNVANDENYLWEYSNIDVYKNKIKIKKMDLIGASRSTIMTDSQFYEKEISDLDRKKIRTNNHANLILPSDELVPFNYFIQTDRKLVALDFLDLRAHGNIAVTEGHKKEYINELLEQRRHSNSENLSDIKRQLIDDFKEIEFQYNGVFKEFESFLLFDYLDKNLDYKFNKSRYSLLYICLSNIHKGSHIQCQQKLYFKFIYFLRDVNMKKILPESEKMKSYKDKADRLISDFKSDFLPKFILQD